MCVTSILSQAAVSLLYFHTFKPLIQKLRSISGFCIYSCSLASFIQICEKYSGKLRSHKTASILPQCLQIILERSLRLSLFSSHISNYLVHLGSFFPCESVRPWHVLPATPDHPPHWCKPDLCEPLPAHLDSPGAPMPLSVHAYKSGCHCSHLGSLHALHQCASRISPISSSTSERFFATLARVR